MNHQMKMGMILVVTWIALFFAEQSHAQTGRWDIRIGYAAPTVDNVLIEIAQKGGFLKKQGLNAELILLKGGVQAMQALLSESVQFSQMAGSDVVRASLAGADVLMVAGFVNRISYVLVARPEISSPADLAGKKVAVASIGGSVDMITRLGLKDLGVDTAHLAFLAVGSPQNRIAALTSKQMDATIVAPESLSAVKKANLKVLKDLSETSVPFQHVGIVVRKSLIREKREMVKALLSAIVESIDFYRSRQEETMAIMERFTGIRDRQVLKESYLFHQKLFPQPPYASRDGFQTLITQIAAGKAEAREISPEAFFDNSLLKELR